MSGIYLAIQALFLRQELLIVHDEPLQPPQRQHRLDGDEPAGSEVQGVVLEPGVSSSELLPIGLGEEHSEVEHGDFSPALRERDVVREGGGEGAGVWVRLSSLWIQR